MPCPYDMVAQLKKEPLPGVLSLLCEARKGPNLSTKLTVISWKKAAGKPS